MAQKLVLINKFKILESKKKIIESEFNKHQCPRFSISGKSKANKIKRLSHRGLHMQKHSLIKKK